MSTKLACSVVPTMEHWASLTLIHERRWCSEGNPVERVPEDRE